MRFLHALRFWQKDTVAAKQSVKSGSVHLPQDVQWLRFWTICALIVAAAVVLTGSVGYVLKQPEMDLRGVLVVGANRYVDIDTLQSRVRAELDGNFFTLSVDKVAQVVAEDSWVRRVRVQREFPFYLRIQVEEQVPVAYWNGVLDGDLINSYGEVFERQTNILDPIDLPENLPQLFGPQDKAADVLSVYQSIAPMLRSTGFETTGVRLGEQGSWSARSSAGVLLQVGRGDVKEVLRRVSHFETSFAAFQKESGRRLQDIARIDLRYPNGYSVAWKNPNADASSLFSIQANNK